MQRRDPCREIWTSIAILVASIVVLFLGIWASSILSGVFRLMTLAFTVSVFTVLFFIGLFRTYITWFACYYPELRWDEP